MSRQLQEALSLLADAIDRQSVALEPIAAEHERRRRAELDRAIVNQTPPQRMSFFRIAGGVAGLAALFDTVVPPDFWTLVDAHTVEISCPCGESPSAPMGRPVECACERFFVYDGDDVKVAFSPREKPPDRS